ncbi:unnamed protein product [Dibothriocephalus latus]|uniref:Uncharacterized protein n=1 Tax=Dibothriocephalus latus TaxID=60516 RepID=A0A3P7LVW3_DIBLA|nr:unnamed protein product [Dibothriocephalus latus]
MLQCTIPSAEPNDSMVDAIDGVMPVESMTTNLTSRSELSCTSSVKKSSEITQDAADRPCSPIAASKNRDEFLFTPSLDNSDVMDVSHANLASSAQISTKGSAPISAVEGDGKTSPNPLQNKPVPSEPENLLTDKEPSFIDADGSSFRAASPNITFPDSRNEIDGPISEKDTIQHITNGYQEECASPCSKNFSEFSNYASQMPCEKSSREQDLQSLAAALTNGHRDLDEPPTTDQYAAASPFPAKTATDLSEQLEVTEQSEKSVPSIECLSAVPELVIASSHAIDRSNPPTDELPLSKKTAADVPLPSNDASTDNCIENLVDSPLSSQAPPDQAPESSVVMSTSSSSLVSPVDSGKTEDVVEHVQKPSQDVSTTDTDAKISLEQQVEYLSGQLSRTQTQLQSLLEEKHRWLVATRPTPAASQDSSSLASEKAALVVKYAQSERLRCKAEARIKELESLLNKNRGNSLTESSSPSPSPALQNDTKEFQKQLDEMTKMLANSRERAETFRHSLRQEESRVSDLNAKLTATREAHRSEQKRAASQVETISRLNRELESARRQLKVLGPGPLF